MDKYAELKEEFGLLLSETPDDTSGGSLGRFVAAAALTIWGTDPRYSPEHRFELRMRLRYAQRKQKELEEKIRKLTEETDDE